MPAICERCIGEDRENLQSHKCYHQSEGCLQTLQNDETDSNEGEESSTSREEVVVYEIPCQECTQIYVYVGETSRTLKKRMSEHKQAMKRFDEKNGIAVHVFKHDHRIAWDEATVATSETSYWRRRVKEAINIRNEKETMSLDCRLTLSNTWRPLLELCEQHG